MGLRLSPSVCVYIKSFCDDSHRFLLVELISDLKTSKQAPRISDCTFLSVIVVWITASGLTEAITGSLLKV